MIFSEIKNKIAVFLLCFIVAFSLVACESQPIGEDESRSFSGSDSGSASGSEVSSDSAETGAMLPDLGVVSVHTDKQKTFISMENLYNVSHVADGTKELGRPLPVNLYWEPFGGDVLYSRIEISEDPDLSDAYSLVAIGNGADVYNLKVGTKYYWRVTAYYRDGNVSKSKISSFETEDECPRNLYVDGTTNWRDLGGWVTASGKKVRQGLIFRTGRLNTSNLESPVAEITASGIKEAVSHLKIRSEIDLRGRSESSKITASVLGEDVKYFRFSMNYEDDLLSINAGKVKEVFDVLSDIDNYPVIFHCHIGTDRTGFVAYLVNGLLGVSKQDLYKDYLFSNFGDIGGSRSMDDIAGRYVASLDKFEGKTLSEKIENYLLSVGVTGEQISAVKSILL